MSDTPEVIDRESPGIADILARREGELSPNMLTPDREPEEREAPETNRAEDDAEAVAEQLRRDAEQWRTRATQAEARAAAEARRAQEASTEVVRTRQSAEDANYSTIATALEARTAEADRLKAQLKAAHENGNFDQVGDIQVRLGEIGADLRDLRISKETLESDRNNRLREPERRQEAPVQTSDWAPTIGMSREQFLAGRTPKTQEWLRSRGDKFFTDQAFHSMVVGADALARGKGIVADTPEYFREIEEQTGMATPPQRGGDTAVSRSASGKALSQYQSAAPPAAPPSRDALTPSGRAVRGGDVHITPDQRRVAEWLKIDPVDYAREQARLESGGELPLRRRS